MRAGAAVGVDDDLAAGETRVALRTADHEAAGRVDQELGFRSDPFSRKHRLDDAFDHGFRELGLHLVAVAHFRGMLRGKHNGVHRLRTSIHIAHGELALRVRTEEGQRAVLAENGLLLHQAVCVVDRGGHQRVGFVARVAEHQTLVAGTGFERVVRSLVNTLLDVGRLLVVANENGTAAVINAVFGIVIANLTEGVAGNADVIDLSGGGDFASEHDESRGAEGFCSDATVGILLENGIENGVRDLVRHLVRMAFTHRFRRKKIIAAHRMLPNLEYSAFAKSNQRACDRRFSGN